MQYLRILLVHIPDKFAIAIVYVFFDQVFPLAHLSQPCWLAKDVNLPFSSCGHCNCSSVSCSVSSVCSHLALLDQT